MACDFSCTWFLAEQIITIVNIDVVDFLQLMEFGELRNFSNFKLIM